MITSNFKLALVGCLIALMVASVFFLHPSIKGDGDTYLEAIVVLDSGESGVNFVPNRILTTFLGLETSLFFINIMGGSLNGWLLMNIIFYFLLAVLFFNLLVRIYDSEKAAFIGTLFLASNYAMLEFGLNFLMDIGGWVFYVLSLFFVFSYLESKTRKHLLLAAVSVGVGGLFKEYAFLGAIPIFVVLLYENKGSFKVFVEKIFIPGLIVLVPTLLLHLFVYYKFGYTYLDWLTLNKDHYIYTSRLKEYIKSIGSLLNLLGLVFCLGIWVLYKEWKNLDEKIKIFLISIALSVLPIFIWPAITQRVLFVLVPFVVVISSSSVKKYEKYWYLFLPILLAYIGASFFMDSVLLRVINLPF